jgi:hypothetical protein
MTLDYKLQLNNYDPGTLEQFKVEYKTTSSAVWTTLTNYMNNVVSGAYNWAPTNLAMPGLDGSQFQVRFTAYGVNSFNINGWGLDDIVVKAGYGSACSYSR